MPNTMPNRKTNLPKLSKKEEKEVWEWESNSNNMWPDWNSPNPQKLHNKKNT